MPAALLYLSVAIPFLYSSSLNDDTNEGIPSTVGSTGRIGFVGIVSRPSVVLLDGINLFDGCLKFS